LARVQQELGAATVLIGHDMGLIAQFSETIGVLYAGKLVERGNVGDVLAAPRHPYTRLLIDSLPELTARKGFVGIPGLPPALFERPRGCRFHPRCPLAFDRCRVEEPSLQQVDSRQVACHLYPAHTQLPAMRDEAVMVGMGSQPSGAVMAPSTAVTEVKT
jgi:peptide/nickel transport system ATP-binding protein